MVASQICVAVNFAFTTAQGVAFTSPTFSGHFGQSVNVGAESDLVAVRSGVGDVATECYPDQRLTSELRFVIASSTSQADAKTKTIVSTFIPGTLCNIATCADRPDLVATNWFVTEAGPRIEGDNQSPAAIVIPLRKRSGITAVAT
jgi:hypothetical protein